jgi:2-methylisocitrate lyase-like PEP mutase family enzyme
LNSRSEKVARLRSLHDRIFVVGNPWDAGSARMLESLGYQALATSSGASAGVYGRRDGAITREESLAHVAAIAGAVDIPVSADLEKCFGDAPEEVAETIRLAAETGLAGGSVEDATGR